MNSARCTRCSTGSRSKAACKALACAAVVALFACSGCATSPPYARSQASQPLPPEAYATGSASSSASSSSQSGAPAGAPAGKGGGRGTLNPYTINGQTYYPIRTANNYTEEGVASWYGPNFHGRYTSNGEVYDMYGMTAAHRILPMGSMVRVTNLVNGRQTMVRINDRGPFARERVLDLSYSAAQELGIYRNGTVKVRLEVLSKWDETLPGAYFVQVGAFQKRENADNLRSRLMATGYDKVRIIADSRGQGLWCVQVGAFNELSAAKVALVRLNAVQPSGYIIAN